MGCGSVHPGPHYRAVWRNVQSVASYSCIKARVAILRFLLLYVLSAQLSCRSVLLRPSVRRQRRCGELRRDAGGPPLSGQPVHCPSPRRRLPLQRSRRERPAGEDGRCRRDNCRSAWKFFLSRPLNLSLRRWLPFSRPATASLHSIPGPSRCEPSSTWKPPASAARKWFSRQVRRSHLAMQITPPVPHPTTHPPTRRCVCQHLLPPCWFCMSLNSTNSCYSEAKRIKQKNKKNP